MAFTAAHCRSSLGSLSSTWCTIICKHCNRSGPLYSRSSRDHGTPPGRSSRGEWRGRSHPSSGRGTARQQQQLTQRGRSVDAWANSATTDQRGGTPIVAGPRANSPARCSPIRQREEEPATKTALLQAVDSPGPVSRAAHHDRSSTHSPAASIPFDSESQHAQPSTHGPADSLPTDSTTQRLNPSDRTSVFVLPSQDHTTGPIADPSNS
ncbi:hypothetical protein M9H77_01468 [Catharanthus roseus]|uniref:Uncharacterized protein n=1 Tax=Catharanthus roseus TaxID=4058 RepID=A0ACC0C5P5_CATRO|nr:hypothetical protein M9H77_01468 [Catharanthus roseus]